MKLIKTFISEGVCRWQESKNEKMNIQEFPGYWLMDGGLHLHGTNYTNN